MTKTNILLIEDSPTLSLIYEEYLATEPVNVTHVEQGGDALKLIAKQAPEVILLDLNLPDMDGMDILKHIHNEHIPSQVVIITAHGSVDVAVDAMKYGAFDFLTKPFDARRLTVTVANAIKSYQLNEIVDTYRECYERDEYFGFVGASMSMQNVYRVIESAAPSNATVFITGESGTGKEVCAAAVHKKSKRRDKSFVAINCAAIPRDLMESEIFGHVKGAFTGAVSDRKGAATLADGGTLFLDEIGEMDLELQSKLLRFIQTGTFQRVGSGKLESVDVRFVCATNRDPLQDVTEGRFREDLYYRLNVIPIELPALRDREDDILLLARKFLSQYTEEEGKAFDGFSVETESIINAYEWPGNIRQLQNVIRNLVVLNQGSLITPDMLPPPLNTIPIGQTKIMKSETVDRREDDNCESDIIPLWAAEKRIIERAIDQCDGNIPKAAAFLEISPSTIYRKKQGWEEKSQ